MRMRLHDSDTLLIYFLLLIFLTADERDGQGFVCAMKSCEGVKV